MTVISDYYALEFSSQHELHAFKLGKMKGVKIIKIGLSSTVVVAITVNIWDVFLKQEAWNKALVWTKFMNKIVK